MNDEIFRDIVANSAVPFFVLDENGFLVYGNRSLVGFLGRSPEDLGDKHFSSCLAPADRDRFGEELRRLLRGNAPYAVGIHRIRCGEGEGIPCEVTLWALPGEFIAGNIVDATERVSLERRLAAVRELGQRAVLLRDVREVGRVIVKGAQDVLDLETCGLWLIRGEELVRVAHVRDGEGTKLSLRGERGIIAQAVRTGHPVYVPDTSRDPGYLAGKRRYRSEFCIPLVVGDEVLGALNAEREEVDGFSRMDRDLLEALAAIAAVAVENAIQFERERKMLNELALINEVATEVELLKAPEALYREVAELIAQRFGYHSVAIFTVEGEEAVLAALAGELAGVVSATYRQPLSVGILGQVYCTGRPYVAGDVMRDPFYFRGYKGDVRTRSELSVPVIRDGDVIAILDIQSREPDAFGEADIAAMEAVARWLAAAQGTVELYRGLERSLEALVRTLAAVVEAKDPFTAGHQQRVAELAVAIAEELGLPPEKREAIRFAALIHDIGKIAVPGEILNRPGSLSPLEWEIVRQHPVTGYHMLKEVIFPFPVAKIVLQHHERMDGSGYPRGLKDDEIVLEARILAVADVVEAMLSHRPYRPAHTLDEALAELERNRGRLYDPDVVDACLRLFREKGFRFST